MAINLVRKANAEMPSTAFNPLTEQWTIGPNAGGVYHNIQGNGVYLRSNSGTGVAAQLALLAGVAEAESNRAFIQSSDGTTDLYSLGINGEGNHLIIGGRSSNARKIFFVNGTPTRARVGQIDETGSWHMGPVSGSTGNTHTVTGAAGAVELSVHSTNAGSTAANIRLRNSSGAFNDVFQITHGGGITKFRDGNNATVGQVDLTSNGIWSWGNANSSGTHFMGQGNAANAVLSLRNYDTSAPSTASQALTIIKGTTDNTTAQNFIVFTINAGSTNSGRIAANGASAAAFQTFSDERLKENIEDLDGELDKIMALRPVEFDYKDGSGHQIGFVAQEIQAVYPDCVSPDGQSEEDYLTVTGWDKTTARLVKAIQELKEEFEAYKDAHP
jgi:Chaperone of endosialidase